MASAKTVTAGRVEALESRVSEVESSAEEIIALRERVAALEGRLAVLEAAPVKSGKAASVTGGKRVKKAPAEPVPLPEAAEGAPEASAYRVSEVQEGVCVGRLFTESDRRWSPAIYGERQCGGAIADGETDLCATCARRLAKYAVDSKPGPWLGRLTEEPLGWCHMLETTWAETKKPRWRGEDAGSASESSSVSSAATGGAKPGRKPSTGAPAKTDEEKAAEKAEKEAKKAAEKAEKEAQKAAEKAEKEAKKAAEKAEKEAQKAAEKAKKAAEKPAAAPKKAAGGKKADVETPAAPAATSGEAAETAHTLEWIDDKLRVVVGNDVYQWNEVTEERGELIGRKVDGVLVPLEVAEEGEGDAADAE